MRLTCGSPAPYRARTVWFKAECVSNSAPSIAWTSTLLLRKTRPVRDGPRGARTRRRTAQGRESGGETGEAEQRRAPGGIPARGRWAPEGRARPMFPRPLVAPPAGPCPPLRARRARAAPPRGRAAGGAALPAGAPPRGPGWGSQRGRAARRVGGGGRRGAARGGPAGGAGPGTAPPRTPGGGGGPGPPVRPLRGWTWVRS